MSIGGLKGLERRGAAGAGRPRARVARMVLATLAAGAGAAGAQTEFTPRETLVSPYKIFDAEYSQSRAEFAWADQRGRLWVGKLDRATGEFLPLDGKSALVDARSQSLSDIKRTTKSGAEWITTADGDQLVYTKFLPRLPHTADNARLAWAKSSGDGTWTNGFIDLENPRMAPYGSEDADDPAPRITYVDPVGQHYLRKLDGSHGPEVALAFIRSIPIAVRHARGDRSLVFTADVGGGQFQVFRYRIDTDRVEQLTFDEGNKDRATIPWMWRAPEFDNALVIMTVVALRELRIYRSPSNDEEDEVPWISIYSAGLPNGGMISSPEPFTHNGKSYVFFDSVESAVNYPTEIWLSNIEAPQPLLRRLSDDETYRARVDPEVFVSDLGPFIYFSRYDPSMSASGQPYCQACAEGVYRVDTGL